MVYKCVGIGNPIMGDDSIGIRVVEELSTHLHENITWIVGETDAFYALSKIDKGDFIFIIDSTIFNSVPGTITYSPLEENRYKKNQIYSQHQANLIDLLNTYHPSVCGFLIGVEVDEIDYCTELSDVLKRQFHDICMKINEFIITTIKEKENA